MDKAEKIMAEAGVDYTPCDNSKEIDSFDESRIYTQVTVDQVAFDAIGWTANTVGELRTNVETKKPDDMFHIKKDKNDNERPYNLSNDSEHRALFYAFQNL